MAYTSIDNPELYFQTKIYTGNGTNSTAITLDGDENMQPDLVWTKCRSHAVDHGLQDSVRGVAKVFHTNSTTAEGTDNWLLSLDSDGFTLSNSNEVNQNTRTFVAWCWKESNSDAGFDIVSYTGNATNRTISHSLSAVPHLMVVKCRSANSRGTTVWHNNLAGTHALDFNLTDGQYESAATWNSTTPTSSVFSVGTRLATNDDTESFIAYLWTAKQGFSKFGKYTGNGSATDGTFVYTGFRPAFLVVKQSSADGEGWYMWDNKRSSSGGANENNRYLIGSANSAEGALGVDCDFLSNGFKHYYGADASNDASDTYVYMAFAEAPFVNSNGVPCNAK